MANFFNRLTNEIQIQNLDATNLQINNIPFSGGGGGSGGDVITSSDNSITVSQTGNEINITNAGINWSTYAATSEVDMSECNFNNISAVEFSSFSTQKSISLYQGATSVVGLNGLYISDGGNNAGNIGNIYDSFSNKPTLSDILSVGGDGLGNNI